MDIIGVVAEYNPFHNGHLYHLRKIKEMYPNSLIILAMSGYFTQRGEISVLSKEDKTKIALLYGIDIVLEIPFVFSVQASDIFAYYSVKILNEFGVQKIIFGSEENNIDLLKEYAQIQLSDPNYNTRVKKYMNEGVSYPSAMAKALGINQMGPNDLLGLSYIKSIYKTNGEIKPISIKRTNNFHDKDSNEDIVSASNIRTKLENGIDVTKYVPGDILDKMISVSDNNLFNLLKFKILTDKDLCAYLDVDEGIEYRLKKYVNEAENLEDFIYLVKTKRYTFNRIKRMFMHILIGLTKKEMENMKLDYIKILGFNLKGQQYLNERKKEICVATQIQPHSLIFDYELKASYLYEEASKIDLNDFDLKNVPVRIENDC